MPSRGRSTWPGRGGQSTRGRGAFQSRQEQTQPATPPPSPRLASQYNRLLVHGQTFFRGRGRGRGNVCWVCQREGCFSWNHPPLENREPPTPPPQDERTPSVYKSAAQAVWVQSFVESLRMRIVIFEI